MIARTIPKHPALEPAEDFYRLRRDGIGFIEKVASGLWTDYNTHDPGITTLEQICFAITDIAYRIKWNIQDILMPATASLDPKQPYPGQAFFRAREILTVNPTTPDDLRELLIDLERVRNSWIFCRTCACEASYYAWCDREQQLQLTYDAPPGNHPEAKPVWPLGLYDIALELEADPAFGDMNDRKIEGTFVYEDQAGGDHPVTFEMRFPDISLVSDDQWSLFLESGDAFENRNGQSFTLKVNRLGAKKGYDVFSDSKLDEAKRNDYVRTHWRGVFYLSFQIDLHPSGKTIDIEYVSLRVISDAAVRAATTAKDLKDRLTTPFAEDFFRRYRRKAVAAKAAVDEARKQYLSRRDLCEDCCGVGVVGVEDVAACADVEVAPDADIERVQGRIWFEIERYFNPPIPFYTLQEMLDAGEAVENVFNGPELKSGFIRDADLENASLKPVLRVSDIVNLLMDIPGVIAVNQLQLTKYDDEGNPVPGAADPTWISGKPSFDSTKTSASWLLSISPQHQPRLYMNFSRFLFFKGGLPFLPRTDEALDTLNHLRGESERAKNKTAPNDLEAPKGRYRRPETYTPVQYGFPLVYGIGEVGLRPSATPERQAQAKQLKAYLMVFEQLLGNSLAQLAHTADLFSLDPQVSRTYFVKEFSEQLLKGFADIQNGLTKAGVEALAETREEFEERRNRFLDHLLARFGEQFGEYALLLGNAAGDKVARARLIEDKISFLENYPAVSHDRAKAFDYTLASDMQDNQPGIKKRISLLLGFPDLTFAWTVTDLGGGSYRVAFGLLDGNGNSWLKGGLTVAAADETEAKRRAYRTVIEQMILEGSYAITADFRLELSDEGGGALGQAGPFDSQADAESMRDELLAWSANERLIVVEHLLLRPKFPGDALYPACVDGGCKVCGDEDPYSFRLTFVMPGWTAQYLTNLDLRRFAERTIQQETPSHLLEKTCWVGNEGFVEDPCDQVIGTLAQLLIDKGLTSDGVPPGDEEACSCAKAIYHAFSSAFRSWYEGKELEFFHAEALAAQIGAAFDAAVKASDLACTTVLEPSLWAKVLALMTEHFRQIALSGWQFERFEAAWFAWLEANRPLDWTEQRLHERVQTIIEPDRDDEASDGDVCRCVENILAAYGKAFHEWMEENLSKGLELDAFPPFSPPDIPSCTNLTLEDATRTAVAALLNERYDSYKEVSYRLRIVVTLLSRLSNTYPGATLHDCDDGSDENVVRLNSTALGNYLRKSTT